MKFKEIHKIYLSNFLTGLLFWYGIEKLFMLSIGINAVGIAAATVALTMFLFIFDIPFGLIADKWSRKGLLVISALAAAVCSVVLGMSHGLAMYIVGDLVYGLYVVSSSGTYQAITYDLLREEGNEQNYSRVSGRAYSFYLIGAGVAEVASGFIAHQSSLRAVYYWSVVPGLINVLVALSLREPKFHKPMEQQSPFAGLRETLRTLSRNALVRVLAIVMTLLAIVDLFKFEFGPLYMLRYITDPRSIGILWAIFSFAAALGNIIAHRFRARLMTLVMASAIPYFFMSFIDNKFGIVLFIVQAVASSALLNQIDTRIQEHSPSHVRASVSSSLNTIGRGVTIPASFFIGWIIHTYNPLVAVWFVSIILLLVLVGWLQFSFRHPKTDAPELAK